MQTKIRRISRRTLSMVLALLMMVSILGIGSLITVNADGGFTSGTTVYLNSTGGDNWNVDSSKGAAAYFYNSNDDNAWTVIKAHGTDIAFTVPGTNKTWAHVIFTRANNSSSITAGSTTGSWSNCNWGQTSDLDYQSGKNKYKAYYSGGNDAWSKSVKTSSATLSASPTSITTQETSTLSPGISGNTTLNEYKSVSYSISPTSGASITGNTFTPTSTGTYTVTATVTYNAKGFPDATATATQTATITVTAPACTPLIKNAAGTAELADTNIYSNQQLKFTVYDPNSHTSSLSITKGGTAQTASTFLSATTSVANGTVVTFTPTAGEAATYVITQTCSNSGSDSVTITTSDPANVTFKYSTNSGTISGGGDGTATNMTYDSDASIALGGKDAHVVYSLTDFSFSGTSSYYWAIWNGSANKAYNTAITSSTTNAKLGETGISLVALSNSLKTITPASTKDHYNLYYDIMTDKFYIEYPIKMTTYRSIGPNYSSTTPEKIADTYIPYNTAFSTPSNPSKTGYSFTSGQWYTNNQACTGNTTDFTTKLTSNTSFYAKMVAKTSKLTFNNNGATTAGTLPPTPNNTGYLTATYGVSMPGYASYVAPQKTGYTLDGWYTATVSSGNITAWGTKYYNADLTSARTWNVNTTSGTTLYAKWVEVKSGVTVKAYTDGSESGTGGKVSYNGGTAAASVTVNSTDDAFGYDTASAAITASPSTGYHFTGWKFNYNGSSNTNYKHLKWSANGTDWNAVANSTTLYNTSSTTIYLKNDGTTGITNANTQVQAMFEIDTYTVSVTQHYYDNATKTAGNKGTIGGTGTVNYNGSTTLTVTNVASGYEFVGWYASGAGDNTDPASTSASYTVSSITSDKSYEARFRKIYYVSFYKTWEDLPTGGFKYLTAPPKTVTVKRGSTTIATYSYEENMSATSEGATRTATGNYNEGDKLKVLAGYSIEAKYSALASSDVIAGAFYNNDIRYTCYGEPDNKYINGRQNNPNTTPETYAHSSSQYYPVSEGNTGDDDWDYDYKANTTLYADKNYYVGTDTFDVIESYESGYKGIIAQNTHTITWTAAGDYLNIDLELADKKQFVFSDSKNAVITCDNTDNYFSIGETVTNHLSVKAAGSTNQTNTITKANIKFYYYDAANKTYTDSSGNPVAESARVQIPASTITVTGSTTSVNSGSTAGSALTFNGTMIATDIYVDLGLDVKYSVELGTRMVSDLTHGYVTWAKVANTTVTYGATTTQDTNYDTATKGFEKNVTAGDTLTYTWTFFTKDPSSNPVDYTNQYMFLGWYKDKGDGTGPDYENGLLSKKTTFTYEPTGNTAVYAVGTRDLFIGGSKYLFENDANHWVHHKMEFDPSYGTSGRYYWTIPSSVFEATHNTSGKGMYYTGNSYGGGNKYFDNNSVLGNSFFKIFDTQDSDSLAYWGQVSNTHQNESDVIYGKWYQRDDNDNKANGYGFISFTNTSDTTVSDGYWTAYKEGYDAPITIYAYPDHTISVDTSFVNPSIYLSNGFKNIDTASPSNVSLSVNGTASGNNGSGSNTTQGKAYYNGAGWTPSEEGTVRHITIKEKDATIEVSKTVNSSNYKVSSFLVYDLYDDSVEAKAPTTVSGTTYKFTYDMETGHDLYIVPIVESTTANMKVIVDATQLDKDHWGDLVGCYAWYSNGTKAYGNYPGQLMVPSDNGLSLSANFPATNNGASLAGITFTNYIDGSNTWLGGNNVMGSGKIIETYNDIGTDEYRKTNCKVQTYDYREPVAFYANKDAGAQSFIMNFALKSGNSPSSAAMTARHSELTGATIPGSFQHTHSDGTTKTTITFNKSDFEYLTTADGKEYVDLNGVGLGGRKPSASYYVVAKGQATYTNGSLVREFYSGNNYDTVTGVTYPNKGSAAGASVSQGFAVEWYVYDSSGNYVTNMLSAGYADKDDTQTLIADALLSQGYAIDGRSVAICYDSPRYCYSKGGSPSVDNGGTTFDAYRFAGQWYQQSEYATAKVYAEVGMFTDNGPNFPGSSTAGFSGGSATVSIDYSKLNYPDKASTGATGGINYAETTISDGNMQAVTLTAPTQNFVGWYYKDASGELKQLTDKDDNTITPTFSMDVTYYAMYEARATYAYQYTGREGAKEYSVDGGELTEAEMNGTATGCTKANQVATDRPDFGTKAPGANSVELFKQKLTWNGTVSAGMLNNTEPYVMKVSNATIVNDDFDLTAYYPNAVGSSTNTSITRSDVEYNNVIDLSSLNVWSLGGANKVFQGWYETTAGGSTTGRLLSTQPNFGQVIVKDTYIKAVYDTNPYSGTTDWLVDVDDHAITREMYTSESGMYYNDSIVRVRQDNGQQTSLPSGAKAGILVVDNGGNTDNDTKVNSVSPANLVKYAKALSTNGQTGKVGSTGVTVTNVFSDNLTIFGRVDLAIRADYAKYKGHNYAVYAYVYDGDGTAESDYAFTSAITGTYEAYTGN